MQHLQPQQLQEKNAFRCFISTLGLHHHPSLLVASFASTVAGKEIVHQYFATRFSNSSSFSDFLALMDDADADADADYLHLCLFNLLQLGPQLRHHACQLLF